MLPKLHIHWERWKYNKTFEVYVSNLGHFRNKSKAALAPKIDDSGYLRIYIQGSKPRYTLAHRVVMLTWRPTPEAEKLTVDHLDHNKRNNAVSNLEWVTAEENLRRAAKDFINLGSAKKVQKAKPIPGAKVLCECVQGKNKGTQFCINGKEQIEEGWQVMSQHNSCSKDKFRKIVNQLLNNVNNSGAKKWSNIQFQVVYEETK